MTQAPMYREHEKRNAGIVAGASMLFLFLILNVIILTNADQKPVETALQMQNFVPEEIVLKEMKIEGGGSGTPSDDPYDPEYKPQTEQIATQPDSKHETNTGRSTHTTDPNADNEASRNNRETENLFSGSGGDGGGKRGGNGFGDGNGDGDGTGPGGEPSKVPRKCLVYPNTDDIISNESCFISLNLTVNANGDVIKTEYNKAKTTTTNEAIINQVRKNVKNQVKFDKRAGAGAVVIPMTIQIQAN